MYKNVFIVNEIDECDEDIRIVRNFAFLNEDAATKEFNVRLIMFEKRYQYEISAGVWKVVAKRDDYARYEHVNGINKFELDLDVTFLID